MGLFTPKKDTTPTTELPERYDDEKSPNFVHPDLREFWPDSIEPASYDFITEQVGRLARSAAIDEQIAADQRHREIAQQHSPLGARPDLNTHDDAARQAMSQRISTLRDENYVEYRQQVEHARKLAAAVVAEASSRSYREAMAAQRMAHTCPICDEFNMYENGEVGERFLSPALDGWYQDIPEGGPSIRSCKVCYLIAAEIYMEQRAAQAVTPLGIAREVRVRNAVRSVQVDG